MNAPGKRGDAARRADWIDALSQTGDALERLAIEDVQRRSRMGDPVRVLDIDCGHSGLFARLAEAGALVTAIDSEDIGLPVRDAMEALGLGDRVHFVRTRLADFVAEAAPAVPYDLIVIHRSIALMPFAEAQTTLRRLAGWLRIGGKLYASAFGLHSELGDSYPDAEHWVQQRFAPLAPEVAAKYGIDGPVCLYSERDLFLLLFEAGVGVLKSFTTTHGNVKAVGVRI